MRKVFSQEQNAVGQEHEEKKKTHKKRQGQQGCNKSKKYILKKIITFSSQRLVCQKQQGGKEAHRSSKLYTRALQSQFPRTSNSMPIFLTDFQGLKKD